MHDFKRSFLERKQHIEKYCALVEFMENSTVTGNGCIEDDLKNQLTIDSELFKTLKSNAYLLLYNNIESTIAKTKELINDHIELTDTSYEDATQTIKKLWVSNNNKDLQDNIDSILNKKALCLPTKTNTISGSIDCRKIEKIVAMYGIGGSLLKNKTTAQSFLKVKRNRNALAHGEKTYAEASRDITVKDLLVMKNDIHQFLESFVNNVELYINDKKFCKSQEQAC